MKMLPDNPNLDHLRRQAKDLLPGLRDSDPHASLANAQSSLAEQYGFRTWTDLKAEVARRHGQADIADPGLAREIASRFELGAVNGPMRSVSRPDESGQRWLLQTDLGQWAPRTVDDVFPVTDGEANARFQEAAAQAGVTLPTPVRSRTGAVVETIEGHQWRVYERLHAGPPLTAPVSATITYAVGEILAITHALRFPAAGICPWNSMRLATIGWAELANGAAAKRADWAPLLAAAVPVLVELESIGADAAAGEPVLCHNNLNPGNVRLGPAGRLIVTGWEHANGLPPEWELSTALANWAVNPNGGINAAGLRALLEGYRAQAGSLPALSLDTFRGAATGLQNYVAGQINLALGAPGKDDKQVVDRSVRHLLTHLPSRGTYERVLDAALARTAANR
jgi:aminoglycoside phosphotransferase (APT) family kinase protein